ncbi:hydroxyacylglutathione hydrolase [Calothrix sp. PCC 6303]|uniref:hydroxyacylglutathione hydrolase n=1 Tax=Calothrix sp. PCC 6303 TaxID=1170562 RepID=UPI0002A026AB|nr:hydroxyacylglutathione hydrolase [Calothrix sp. PCC 6303]AFZ01025.1 Hydroxyacylglutathione hydrolase [Calothrix sp. PCC 6303]
MQVILIPALADNYIFLLYDSKRGIAAVIDPAVAEPVLTKLHELQAELVAIFNTHHHHDHVGGNKKLIQCFPDVKVYGGVEDRGRIPEQQVYLEDGSKVEFGNRQAEVFFVPGHTSGHIAYYFPPQHSDEMGELFCGDTLFGGGCGRLFEGTPSQMVSSLSKLRSLPNSTRVWCAHEYTQKNLEFALTVDSGNIQLQQRYDEVKSRRHRQEATVPLLLGTEKLTNPFLRWDIPALQAAVGGDESVVTFARLRGMKDKF